MADQELQKGLDSLIAGLPVPVRNFLLNNLESATKKIMGTYRLHADQAATLQRDLTLVLLGVRSPQELGAALVAEAHLKEEVAETILKDINTQIFVPLNRQMREEDAKKKNPQPPQARPYTPTPQRMLPDHEEPHINIREATPPRPAPPPPANLPGAIPPIVIRPPAPPAPPAPGFRPPASNVKPIVKEYGVDPYRETIEQEEE